MDFWQETNWFAVQSKPHHENLAAASVVQFDVEVFLPKIRQDQFVGGISRRITKPLFLGYFFARFCPAVSSDAVRYSLGVVRVVGSNQVPIPLSDEVIEEIRSRVQPDGFVSLAPRSFRQGDKVVIEHGPFEGLMGCVEKEVDDGKRVAILLEAISKARVWIEKRWLASAAEI